MLIASYLLSVLKAELLFSYPTEEWTEFQRGFESYTSNDKYDWEKVANKLI